MSFLEYLLGLFCLITAQIRFILPGLQIYEIYKTKVTHKFPYTVLIFTLFNCMLWLIYFEDRYMGVHIWLNAFMGKLENIFYLLVFISCLDINIVKKRIIMACTVIMPFLICYIWCYLKIKVQITGYMALFFNCSMFLAPMQKVRLCIEEHDNEYLPIRLILLNLFCSIGFVLLIWFYRWDNIMFSIFIFSIIISSLQVFIWNKYRKIDNFIQEISSRKESLVYFQSFSLKKVKKRIPKNKFKSLKKSLLTNDFQ